MFYIYIIFPLQSEKFSETDVIKGTEKGVVSCRKVVKRNRHGKGLLKKVINNLPLELHIPVYQYCGQWYQIKKRLARGDPGINPPDKPFKEHDVGYSENRDNIASKNTAAKS